MDQVYINPNNLPKFGQKKLSSFHRAAGTKKNWTDFLQGTIKVESLASLALIIQNCLELFRTILKERDFISVGGFYIKFLIKFTLYKS